MLTGTTTVYGTVIRVSNGPLVQLRLLDGREIDVCTTPTIAQDLRAHLHRTVGLAGRAKWDEAFSLTSFTADERIEYDDSADIGEVLGDLSCHYGQHFKDITDVDAYVRSLRDHE